MSDLLIGVALGLVFGAIIMGIVLGSTIERLLKRVSELEKAENGPEPPETAQKGV